MLRTITFLACFHPLASIAVQDRGQGGGMASRMSEKSLYDFTVKDIDGNDVSLSKYREQVLLIVNVASR